MFLILSLFTLSKGKILGILLGQVWAGARLGRRRRRPKPLVAEFEWVPLLAGHVQSYFPQMPSTTDLSLWEALTASVWCCFGFTLLCLRISLPHSAKSLSTCQSAFKFQNFLWVFYFHYLCSHRFMCLYFLFKSSFTFIKVISSPLTRKSLLSSLE